MIHAQDLAGFHPVAVEHVTAQGEVAQDAGGPLPKLGGPDRVDPVPDRNDRIEVVVLDAPGHLSGALGANYPEIPDRCFGFQFPAAEDVAQVLADRAHIDREEFGHQLLGEPDRALIETHLDRA